MKIYTHEKLVKRNAKIGQITGLVAMAILGAGLYITFQNPELFSISLITLFVGFLLSQVGIFYTNKWGKKPTPHEVLNTSLKGLDKRYSLIHYFTPASHVFLGPAGLIVFIYKHQKGKISYLNGRFKQKGGNLYMKIFGQESLGRPSLEASSEVQSIQKYLTRIMKYEEAPSVEPIIVFSHPDVNLDSLENAPIQCFQAKKLKDHIRKMTKEKVYNRELINSITDAIIADKGLTLD